MWRFRRKSEAGFCSLGRLLLIAPITLSVAPVSQAQPGPLCEFCLLTWMSCSVVDIGPSSLLVSADTLLLLVGPSYPSPLLICQWGFVLLCFLLETAVSHHFHWCAWFRIFRGQILTTSLFTKFSIPRSQGRSIGSRKPSKVKFRCSFFSIPQ